MNLLLDTHIFLWFISGDGRLPKTLLKAIEDPTNNKHVSVASIWEVVIKWRLGKLPLPYPPASYLAERRDSNGFVSISIDEGALIHLEALPSLHRDPFDRILLAQAMQHDLQILTLDADVRAYGLNLFVP